MGKKPVFVRQGGASAVVAWFTKLLWIDSVLLGFGLPDDNLCAPHEMPDLDCFYASIRTAAALNESPGKMK